MNKYSFHGLRQWLVTAILIMPFLIGCSHHDMKPSEPDLELKKDIDLGLILDTTAPVELFIPIKNRSNRTITISKIAKDCSCISVTIDKRKLEPGETATLRYSANIYGKTDRFSSDIVIESDASERFEEIQIRGQITGQVRVRPLIVVVLTGEQESPGAFTVFSDDQDGKWNYTGFVSDNPHLKVDLRANSSSPTTTTYDGAVTVSREWAKSSGVTYSEAGITLKFRNDHLGRDLEVIVPVQIAVRRSVTIDPPSVTFLANSGEQRRTLLVQSPENLAVDTTRLASPYIAATLHRIDAKSMVIDLIYRPALAQGTIQEKLDCDLMSQGKEIGSIPISIVSISP